MPRPNELCQLAGAWDRKAMPDNGWFAETKVDGWRGLVYPAPADGKRAMFSRHGVMLHGVGHILHRLSIMEAVAGEPLMFDGEFQVGGTLEATKAWCERGWRTGGEAGTFHLFDAMPFTQWQRGSDDRRWIERRNWLEAIVKEAESHPLSWEWRAGTHGKEPDGPIVVMADAQWLGTPDDVIDAAKAVWRAGGEGLMLKDPDAPYLRARSKAWQKVKNAAYVPGKGTPWHLI